MNYPLVDYLSLHKGNLKLAFPDNMTQLFGNLYLVRTQAGLKQAIKHYSELGKTTMNFKQIVDYLRFSSTPNFDKIKYPLLIEFVPFYMGYHGTEVIGKSLNQANGKV